MRTMRAPKTILDKIFDAHAVHEEGGRTLLYVDRAIAADTALSAFNTLRNSRRPVRQPAQAIQIPDHFTPSSGPTLEHAANAELRTLIRDTDAAARSLGIPVVGMGDPRRGIQHVVAVEQAYAQPGIVIAATDSHTPTQGAVGALALSVSTDLAHVLATQCVWIKRPKPMRINLEGKLAANVTAKDVALAIVARIGSAGAAGFAVEFAGSASRCRQDFVHRLYRDRSPHRPGIRQQPQTAAAGAGRQIARHRVRRRQSRPCSSRSCHGRLHEQRADLFFRYALVRRTIRAGRVRRTPFKV